MGLWENQQEEQTLNSKCEAIKLVTAVKTLLPSQVFNKRVQCRDSLVVELVENFNSMTLYL